MELIPGNFYCLKHQINFQFLLLRVTETYAYPETIKMTVRIKYLKIGTNTLFHGSFFVDSIENLNEKLL
jgi:hypothetical protein